MTETTKPRKRGAKAPLSTVEKMVANQRGPEAVTSSTNGAPKPKPKPKPKAKPGDANFPWETEYPGEELFVFTASDGTTVGLTRLGPKRRPKPGKLALLEEELGGGVKVLWYFLKLASSDVSRQVQAELEEEDYAAMCRQWAEFAGIELGE